MSGLTRSMDDFARREIGDMITNIENMRSPLCKAAPDHPHIKKPCLILVIALTYRSSSVVDRWISFPSRGSHYIPGIYSLQGLRTENSP